MAAAEAFTKSLVPQDGIQFVRLEVAFGDFCDDEQLAKWENLWDIGARDAAVECADNTGDGMIPECDTPCTRGKRMRRRRRGVRKVREKRSERRCEGVWTAMLCVEKLVSSGWHVTADVFTFEMQLQGSIANHGCGRCFKKC